MYVSRTLSIVAAVGLTGEQMSEATAAPQKCTPPPGTTAIEFKSGKNHLRGFIDLPARFGKHPAIVILDGSGESNVTEDTASFEEMRRAFRNAGIAVLIWDKAGNGCSTGEYSHGFPILDRATEAIAAVETLREREDIDAAKIGLWGRSQGAMIAPMVAVRSNLIAYMILVSGPGRDAISQMTYAHTRKLIAQGFSEVEANKAQAQLLRAWAILTAGGDSSEFLAAVESLRKYSLLNEVHMLNAGNHGYMWAVQTLPEWTLSMDVLLREIQQPTLAMFGEKDVIVDWRESVKSYRAAFLAGGNNDLTIRVFENATHDLAPESQETNSRFVEGYIETMLMWLQQRGFAGRPQVSHTSID